MATESGTCDNYLDLLTRLRDFLTANTDLVTAGEEWDQIGGPTSGDIVAGDFLSFKGKGLGGTDEILVSLTSTFNAAAGYYNIGLRGHTAYNEASPGIDQIGTDSKLVYLPLANTSMAYWFFANGRHFKVVVRHNTRYDAMYAGFLLPEHLPTDWSYPLFIGGSSCLSTMLASSDSVWHSNFWNPGAQGDENGDDACAYLFSPVQAWVPIRNVHASTVTATTEVLTGTRGRCTVPWSNAADWNLRRCLDNSAWFERGQLAAFGSDINSGAQYNEVPELGTFYGAFDGVYFTPSFGAVAEGIVTDPSTSEEFQMFPNVFRTSDAEFAAFLVE